MTQTIRCRMAIFVFQISPKSTRSPNLLEDVEFLLPVKFSPHPYNDINEIEKMCVKC